MSRCQREGQTIIRKYTRRDLKIEVTVGKLKDNSRHKLKAHLLGSNVSSREFLGWKQAFLGEY